MKIMRTLVMPLTLVLCTLFVRLTMLPYMNGRPLLPMFVVPIVIAGAVGGWVPALVSTGVAWWATNVYILQWNNRVPLQVDSYEQVVLLIAGLTIAGRCWQLQRAQKRANASEAMTYEVLNRIGPRMFMSVLSPKGVVIETSRAGLRAGKAQRRDVIGKRWDKLPWWIPETQAMITEALEDAITGVSRQLHVQTLPDGDLEKISIDVYLTPVFDAGEVCYIVTSGMVIDPVVTT